MKFDKKSSRNTKFHKIQNYRKGWFILAHFWDKCKKLKRNSQDRKNIVFDKLLWKCSTNVLFLGPVTFILTKMRQSKSTLPVISSLMTFFEAQTSITFYFLQWLKSHISAIYKLIILIFLVNLPLVFIYKFYMKEIQIQQLPGEPWEQHLGEVRQGTLKFNISNHHIFSVNLPIVLSIFIL